MLHPISLICGRSVVPQVREGVVFSIAVTVTALHALWAGSAKSIQNDEVDCAGENRALTAELHDPVLVPFPA